MPELPEVQTIVSELNRKLKNKTIKSVLVNEPKMISVGPAVLPPKRQVKSYQVIKFIKLLKGQKIAGVRRRAKLLIFDLSPTYPTSLKLPPPLKLPTSSRLRRTSRGTGRRTNVLLNIIVHLKMTGQFIYEDKKQRAKTHGKYRMFNKLNAPLVQLPGKHTHVTFNFADGSALFFNDIRKFGYMKLVRDDELNSVKELQGYGPEPLTKQFTFDVFKVILAKRPKGKIKQVLMDSSLIAGIGNIYSDEILFHAKVRPTRTVGNLSESEQKAVYKYIPIVLKKGIAAKGSSVGDFVRTDGSWGQMGKFHFVYGRKGQVCKVCKTKIEAIKIGGRTGSYCPKCQK